MIAPEPELRGWREVIKDHPGWVLIAAMVLDLLCGWVFAVVEYIPVWHGIYDEVANAVTLGGDVQPAHPWGYLVNIFVCLTVIPLFGAGVSLFITNATTARMHGHIKDSEVRLKEHVEGRVAAAEERIKRHVGR